jgi:hypothetical protein
VSSIERTAYAQLCEPVTPAELQRDFIPTEEEKLFAANSARRASHRLGILVLLKVFLKLRRFPRPEEIPDSVANFIRARRAILCSSVGGFRTKSSSWRFVGI